LLGNSTAFQPTETALRHWGRRHWLPAVAVVTFALYAWYLGRASFAYGGTVGFSLFDDAMISMRYARNLATGAGLRWNAGGPPVEGYSNFLWTLWMALLQLLPVAQLHVCLLVSLSGAALLIVNLWLVRGLVKHAGGSPASAKLAVVFSALGYPLVFFSLRGLEVGLLAFLVDAAVLLAWRGADEGSPRTTWLFAVVLAAMVLVRDDAIVAAAILIAFVAARPRARGAAGAALFAVLAATAGHLCFRALYYGAVLPNTYYLRLGGVPLLVRLARGAAVVLRTSLAELAVPLALFALALHGHRGSRRLRLIAAMVLGQFFLTLFVGGDAWESWGQPDRFLAVAFPLIAVGATLGAEALWENPAHRTYAAIGAAVFGLRSILFGLGDLVPFSFTENPPLDLHSKLRELSRLSGLAFCLAFLFAALAFAWPGSRRPLLRFPAVLSVLLIAATVGRNWRDFLASDVTARQIAWDGRNAVFGLRLGESVPKTTVIAVVAAGAVPFFSNLPAVDLLGKSDAHVARENPVEAFVPGHDKRDYAFSLATYRPDLVLELWHHAPEELRAIDALGYQELPNGMYVRSDGPPELVDTVLHRLPDSPYAPHRVR
jgi:arabinofuranosyltransferase